MESDIVLLDEVEEEFDEEEEESTDTEELLDPAESTTTEEFDDTVMFAEDSAVIVELLERVEFSSVGGTEDSGKEEFEPEDDGTEVSDEEEFEPELLELELRLKSLRLLTVLQVMELVISLVELQLVNLVLLVTKARMVFPSTIRYCRRIDLDARPITNFLPVSQPSTLIILVSSTYSQESPFRIALPDFCLFPPNFCFKFLLPFCFLFLL